MCPLKREQATRVSYNTLTHSIDSIVEIGRKNRSWIKHNQNSISYNSANVKLAAWHVSTTLYSFCFVTAIQALTQVKVIHVGSVVRFSCDTTDVKDTFWEFSSASYSSQSLTVYEYPDITPRFMSRHSVSHNNLSINKVQLCDAGNYRCSFPSGDDLGTGNFELIVLG